MNRDRAINRYTYSLEPFPNEPFVHWELRPTSDAVSFDIPFVNWFGIPLKGVMQDAGGEAVYQYIERWHKVRKLASREKSRLIFPFKTNDIVVLTIESISLNVWTAEATGLELERHAKAGSLVARPKVGKPKRRKRKK